MLEDGSREAEQREGGKQGWEEGEVERGTMGLAGIEVSAYCLDHDYSILYHLCLFKSLIKSEPAL